MPSAQSFATTVTAGSAVAIGPDGATVFSASLPYGIVRLPTGFHDRADLDRRRRSQLHRQQPDCHRLGQRQGETGDVLLNWVIAFGGNLIGAFLTAVLMFETTQYTFGAGAVGGALTTAHTAVACLRSGGCLGHLCNALVCLAVWMCFAARTTVDQVRPPSLPVAAFAAAGFEHCIANAYFIPMGLLARPTRRPRSWSSIGKTAADFPALTLRNFLVGNLLPVTIGNLIGGTVAAVYWFIYLRKRPRT